MSLNNKHDKPLGIYLHIPFCIRKCNYCDFCSFPDADGMLMSAYVDELIRRINFFSANHCRRRVDTVYFGGGTPTLMSIEHFNRIFTALNFNFEIAENAEITVECNPASIDYEGLSALRNIGINRLSIGLQSAKDRKSTRLNSSHA